MPRRGRGGARRGRVVGEARASVGEAKFESESRLRYVRKEAWRSQGEAEENRGRGRAEERRVQGEAQARLRRGGGKSKAKLWRARG